MASDHDPHHFPPDLLTQLVDTIPRLVKSKGNVLDFFTNAGVSDALLADLRAQLRRDPSSVNKFDLARTVLIRVNDGGDATLRDRREIIKRICEWEDFSTCWPNELLAAKGRVAEVRRVVGVRDSFTRMTQEREREVQANKKRYEAEQAAKVKRQTTLTTVRDRLAALFGDSNAQRRGKALEGVLNEYFKVEGVGVREAFTVVGNPGDGIIEQIDGVIDLDGSPYVVEMKWYSKPLGPDNVALFLVKVFSRGNHGLFIGHPGITGAAVSHFKDANNRGATAFACTLKALYDLLDSQGDLNQFLKTRKESAVIGKEPFLDGSAADPDEDLPW